MTQARRHLGAKGEELAAAWYRANGYTVLDRNWRCREGEIDLVCSIENVLVICEVKTRTSDAYGHPAESVTPAKQRRLRVLAARWLQDASDGFHPTEIRFDVAAVLAGELEVITEAF